MSGEGHSTAGSLADRITHPNSTAEGMNVQASSFQPTPSASWADDVTSPTATENPPPPASNVVAGTKATEATEASTSEHEPNIPQMDGATAPFGGSQLHEPNYAVEVKLADMQADPNNPLYSATSFEQLGLSVLFPFPVSYFT